MSGRYRPGPAPTSQDIGQTQRFLRDELQQIRSSLDSAFDIILAIIETILEDLVYAAYGQMSYFGNQAIGNIVPGTDYLLTGWNLPLISVPKDVTYVAGEGVILQAYGIWCITCNVRMTFDASASANRTIIIQLYDVTDGADLPANIQANAPRNADALNTPFQFLVEIDPATVGHTVGLVINSPDSFTNFSVLSGTSFGAFHAGEYQGVLDELDLPLVAFSKKIGI